MKKILSKLDFWTVMQAYKRYPVKITKEELKVVKKKNGFIDVKRYSENLNVIIGEVGIYNLTRLVLKK